MSDWEIDTDTRVEVVALINEMLYRLDHNLHHTIWELYTDDIEISGPLGLTKGIDSAKESAARRAQMSIVGRHFIGGIRLWREGDVLRGIVQYQTFRDSSPEPTHPASVGEFREEYRKVDGKWKFAKRDIVPIFGAANAAAHASRIKTGGQ